MTQAGVSNGARSFLGSPVLLFILAGLHPAVFLLSRNWFIYFGSQAWALLIGTPAATLVVGLIVMRAGSLIARAASARLASRGVREPRVAVRNLVCALAACLLYFFLLQSTIFSRYDPAWLKVSLFAAVAALLLLLVAATGLSTVNVVLSILVALAAFGWFAAAHRAARAAPATWNTTDRELVERLRFARKPNVYLIHLESYQSREALQAVYRFDNRKFQDELGTLGFRVADSHFANYSFTLASLASLFGMRHHYYRIAMGNEDALGARELIGGKAYNPVLRAFLNNGYRCQIVFSDDLYFDAGDDWTFVYPARNLAGAARIYQSRLIDRLVTRAAGWKASPQGFDALVRQRILAAAASKEPCFLYLGLPGTEHSPVDKKWNELAYWDEYYPRGVRRANPGYLDLARLIVSKDPEAVILIYGDHGSWRYRKILEGPRDLRATMEAQGVRGSTLALDLFGAFFAVRFPGGDAARFDGASHVNLLRVLLAGLSGSEEFRSTAVEDDSYFMRNVELYSAVRGGKPLDVWERVVRR